VSRPIPPPPQSQRRRPDLPVGLLLPAPARDEFLGNTRLRDEVAAAVAELSENSSESGHSVARLWAELLAHLEPVPEQMWLETVGFGMAAVLSGKGAGGMKKEIPGAEKMARDSWLLGYRMLRKLHRQWDRESARADRRQGGGVHPQLWRVPELRPHTNDMIETAGGQQPLKAHKRGVVSRIPDRGLILKHFPPHKKVDPRNAMGLSKAIGSLHACESLNRRGLRAAVGYAAWSQPKMGSWLLLEDLHGFDALQQVIAETSGDARAALLARLAQYARRMHLLGVAYRDFKPSNILVRYRNADDIEIAVIDHDRNWFLGHEIPPSRARRDLAALHAGLPNQVRASERMRALRLYGGRWREHRSDWGYRGPLWEQQIPKLVAEAVRRDRLWKPVALLGGE
jgi:hypothetical protein